MNKVDTKTAELEFDRWAEAMDLDLDESKMDGADRAQFRAQKDRVVQAIERGALVIGADGLATYTAQRPGSAYKDPITFNERTGASLMAMDGKGKNHDVAKTYAMMADMCGVNAKVFAGMVGTDAKVCEALYVFLMA
jgi:hypothetical protein